MPCWTSQPWPHNLDQMASAKPGAVHFDILAAPTSCSFARAVQHKFKRARDQLLTFALWPGKVEATNNACERALRPAVIQRKVTNGYRAMWAAEGEADIRTVVHTARLRQGANVFKTILQAVGA